MPEERLLSSRKVFEGRAVNLRVETVQKPDGRQTTREIVEHSNCIVVVPMDEAGNVLLVRQFREAVDRALLELPAGGIEPGETPEDCVRRELQEEIGYLPREIEGLGGFYSAPGYSTEYLYLYVASDLVPSRREAEDTEAIRVERVPLTRTPELIASGEICDAKSVAGLLKFICLGKKN